MGNHLSKLKEFQAILANYHIAPAGRATLQKSKLALMIGPTASGRDTINAELLKTGEFYFMVSNTTRQPRVNNGVPERNGVEYWFKSEKAMLSDLKTGRLLEAEIIHDQQVSGISISELEKANQKNKIAITNVELNIGTIVKAKPDTMAFLVLPPSFEEWLSRLNKRGKMPKEEKRRRLETAIKIFAAGLERRYFNFVVNDDLDEAVEQIYIRTVLGFKDLIIEVRGRRLCEQLYLETKNYLETL